MTGPLSRRGLLAAGGTGLGLALGACGTTRKMTRTETRKPSGSQRISYGKDDQQYADLTRPSGNEKGLVVLVHGGYWQAGYGADLMVPLARAFTSDGYATWNIEYRRVGSDGGWPATFEDVAGAMDRLAGMSLPPAVLLGHSAGGHLAAWAASRTAETPGGAPRGKIAGAVCLSGLLDLTAAAKAPESGSPTRGLMGGAPETVPERYALGDPALLAPAGCPLWAVQPEGEQVIPIDQADRYVAAATRAGGEAETVSVPGDHFTLIDPRADSFTTIARLVTEAAAALD